MAGLAIQGADSAETKKIALAVYKVNLLKTIVAEGEYSLQVEPYIPVKFMYQRGTTGAYNRIAVMFHSGSDFLGTDELRLLGMLATSVSNFPTTSSVACVPWFEIVPTENILRFAVKTSEYGIVSMSTSGVKAHIFQ